MLGDIIRYERKKCLLSQAELARRSGHPVSSIHGIESGGNQNLGFFTLGDIAQVLGVSLDELYKTKNAGENKR